MISSMRVFVIGSVAASMAVSGAQATCCGVTCPIRRHMSAQKRLLQLVQVVAVASEDHVHSVAYPTVDDVSA